MDMSWDPVFRSRLEKVYDEMKWLYGELYHGDENAFNYFCSMLNWFYEQRSPELKAWDEGRLADPSWYKGNNLLGMLMYTSCFAGTLKGVREHLDYLKESGINYLHLMPLLKSPKDRSDGGYAVSDFCAVQPELGTMEDLADLAGECHRNNMSLCLDFVMNHTSEDHDWAVKAKTGDLEAQGRFFFFDDWTIPNQFEETVPQVFPTTAPGNFSWCPEVGKVVMTTFYPYQWDLNYGNPMVFNDMTANMLTLCNHGIDIIRLDAVPYIWKQLGTPCRNLPQVHTLVRIMRMACEVVCPCTLLLGEVVMEPSKVVPYFGTIEKPECHMLYNVTTMCTMWNTVATGDVRLLRHQMDSVFALPKEYIFLNYLRCHDDIGWGLDYDFLKQFGEEEVAHKKYLNDYLTGKWWGSMSRGELYNDDPRLGDARLCGTTASLCGIEAAEYENNHWKLDQAIRLDLMLHVFLMTQSGIPVLYSGDEIGQRNDYSYHDDPVKCVDSRYLHRGKFDWNDAELRNNKDTRQGRIYQTLRWMEEIRATHRVFNANADVWTIETWNNSVLGIGRYYEGEKLLAFFNFSANDETAWIEEDEEYTNLSTNARWKAFHVGIEAHGFVWLLKDYPKEEEERIARENEERRKREEEEERIRRINAEVKARLAAEAEARRAAEKAAKEEAARKAAEEEAARLAAEEAAKKAAEEEAARLAAEEAAKVAEEEAAKKAAEAAEAAEAAAAAEEAAPAPAEEPAPEKPKRNRAVRAKKTEKAAEAEAEAPAEEKPKRKRVSRLKKAAEAGAETETAAEEKPKKKNAVCRKAEEQPAEAETAKTETEEA